MADRKLKPTVEIWMLQGSFVIVRRTLKEIPPTRYCQNLSKMSTKLFKKLMSSISGKSLWINGNRAYVRRRTEFSLQKKEEIRKEKIAV